MRYTETVHIMPLFVFILATQSGLYWLIHWPTICLHLNPSATVCDILHLKSISEFCPTYYTIRGPHTMTSCRVTSSTLCLQWKIFFLCKDFSVRPFRGRVSFSSSWQIWNVTWSLLGQVGQIIRCFIVMFCLMMWLWTEWF